MGKHHLLLAVLITVMGMVLAACERTSSDDEDVDAADDLVAADDEASDGDDEPGDSESDGERLDLDTWEPHSPELDVETLEASGPEGTYQAERHENTYVGAVNDELFISVALEDGYPSQSEDEVTVYLCDGADTQLFLSGELDTDSASLSEDGAEVELTVDEEADTVAGTVTLANEAGQPFEAVPAEEQAGLYTSQLTAQDIDFWAGWVVLNDGRQQGLSCCCTFVDGVPPGCYTACCVLN